MLDGVNDAYAAGMDHRWQLDLPDEPVVVPGDASRLTQVLTNLLANARTHTPAGTTVSSAWPRRRRRRGSPSTDDGPGIAPDLLPHVFERFARGSASRSRADREHGAGPGDRRRRGGRARRSRAGDEPAGADGVHGVAADGGRAGATGRAEPAVAR